MNQQEFDSLVARLEDVAHHQPKSYKLRVGLLAILGYLYILVVLGLILGVLFALTFTPRLNAVVIKFGWVLLVLAYVVVRALWVRIPAPEGIELTQAEVPHLFATVRELTTRLRAPRFHHILLTDDFNAAVVQVPRLGVLGWQKNYLLLGLPLMQALSPEQFTSVVAHELGHLSGNHGRFASWIYRLRVTWIQLLDRLEREQRWGTFIFQKFIAWYAPFLNAYSFVLARAHEYEADRCAAELAGTRQAAEALVNVHIKGDHLSGTFYPSFYKQADVQSAPPAFFASMSHSLRGAAVPTDANRWLARALTERARSDDTHPPLRDRLRALGYTLDSPHDATHNLQTLSLDSLSPVNETAAQRFLANAETSFTVRLDAEWQNKVAAEWEERFKYAQESQDKLRELERKAEALTIDEAWERARLIAEFRGNEAAVPVWREILSQQPDHAPANYMLGRALLEEGDESGVALIEKAMSHDSESILPGCELLIYFYEGRNKPREAEAYRRRAGEHYEVLVKAQQERSSASEKDSFLPHDLPPEAVNRLREQLSYHDEIVRAYVLRKDVVYMPESPMYVVVAVPRRSWMSFGSAATKNQELAGQLAGQLEVPGYFYVLVTSSPKDNLKRTLRDAEAIYERA